MNLIDYLSIPDVCSARHDYAYDEWQFDCGMRLSGRFAETIEPDAVTPLDNAHRRHHAEHSGRILEMIGQVEQGDYQRVVTIECEHEKVPA